MINSKELRDRFRALRGQQRLNGAVGQWVVGFLILASITSMLALLVRGTCLAIVALHRFIN